MTKPKVIWAAVISHKHGYNLYTARTYETILATVAQYAKDWWDDRGDEDVESYEGLSDQEIIEAYFDNQYEDSYEIDQAILQD